MKPAQVFYFKRLWDMRHLTLHLASSKLRSRFARTRLGMLWLVLNPIVLSVILGFVMGRLMGVADTGSMILYVLVGLVTFEWFSQSVAQAVGLLPNEAAPLLKQAPVPFAIFPLQHLIFTTISFLMSLTAFAIVGSVILGGSWIGMELVALPPILVLGFVLFLPWSMVISVLGGVLRELAHVVPYVMLLIYYTSPVFIPRSVFDGPLLSIYTRFNPVTSIMDIFRDVLLQGQWPELMDYLVVAGWAGIGWVVAIPMLVWGRKRLVFYG